jgi:hypothetical protein
MNGRDRRLADPDAKAFMLDLKLAKICIAKDFGQLANKLCIEFVL